MSPPGDRVAIVTGASRGIGAEVARRLASQGVTVAALARDGERLAEVQEEIMSAGGKCLPVVCDVADGSAIEAAVRQVEADCGAVSYLVNNAGCGGPFKRVDQTLESEWDLLFNTNVKGPFLLAKSLLPKMREAGFGRILNIASVHGLVGAALSSTYVATKHALVGLTRSIALEWGGCGITCNAICPGYISTPMTASYLPDGAFDGGKIAIPLERLGTPQEVADVAVFLLGPQSSYINGACLVVDGGLLAGLRPPLEGEGHAD